MIRSSFLRLTSFSLALAATSAAAADPKIPTDPFGRPLFDEAGSPLIYGPGTSPVAKAVPSAAPFYLSAMAGEPWNPPVSPGGAPFWGSGVFGSGIGDAGWVVIPGPNGPSLVVSGTTPASFKPNNFWYVLNYDPVTKTYYQVHVQQPYAPGLGQYPFGDMAAMASAQVLGGPAPELVVGMADGRFFYYSLTSFEEVRRFTLPTGLNDFIATDLTGDGLAELVTLTDGELRVFNAAGVLLWSLAGPGGEDLVVAQMDADPSLEIATSSGHVVDVAQRKIEWTHSEGFGINLRAADIDGDSRAELISAEDWYYIRAYDVEEKLEKWSFRTERDISSIEIANVDGDPAPELLYGDNQGGYLHALSLGALPPLRKWQVGVPNNGVSRIAALDADQDGVIEVFASGGANSTGEDLLNVYDSATRDTEWNSRHLDGPFFSPVMGDVTGDGKPEMVTISRKSRSGYGSGCILVYDPETLAILAISQATGSGHGSEGTSNFILRDIDGDSRQEIVMASDAARDGLIEIYKFTDAGTFESHWQFVNHDQDQFTQLEVIDVDGDGNLEVVTTSEETDWQGTRHFLLVVDLATKAVEWKTWIAGVGMGARGLVVSDVDGDGDLEAVVAMGSLGIQILDLKNRVLEDSRGGDCIALAVRPGATGFYAGFADGNVAHLIPDEEWGYIAPDSWKASDRRITGLSVGSGQSLWVSAQDRISLWPDKTSSVWSTATLQTGFDNPVGTLALYEGPDGTEVFAGLSHGLSGFRVGGSPDFATVQMTGSGTLAEGSPGTVTLTFTRSVANTADTAVAFTLAGDAVELDDYQVSDAFQLEDGLWSVLIPAGETSVVATLKVVQDGLAEGPESLLAALEPATGYFIGSSSSFATTLQDDEAVISVEAGDASASELKSGRTTDNATFVLHRSGGDLSRPLTARVNFAGSASLGSDYRRVSTNVTFRKGSDTAVVTVIPIHDREAEQTETVRLELVPDPLYFTSPVASEATVSILDAEPTVLIVGTGYFQNGESVNFGRIDGHMLAMPLTLQVTREENGTVKTTRQKINFKANSAVTRILLKPSPRATESARITVELLDTDTFHPGAVTSVSILLSP